MTFTKRSLAWVELALTDEVFHYTADSVGSSYRIEQKNPFAENATEEDLKWELWEFSQDFGYSRNYDSAEAAKAAAELEHSERLAPFLEPVEDGELEAMRSLLREKCWSTAGLPQYDRQGYSMEIEAETSIRDVNYRNADLYPTADAAIDATLARHKAGKGGG